MLGSEVVVGSIISVTVTLAPETTSPVLLMMLNSPTIPSLAEQTNTVKLKLLKQTLIVSSWTENNITCDSLPHFAPGWLGKMVVFLLLRTRLKLVVGAANSWHSQSTVLPSAITNDGDRYQPHVASSCNG